MSQLVIETETIKKAGLYLFAILGIVIIGGLIGMSLVDHYILQKTQQSSVPAVTAVTAPAPTVVPTVVPTQSYPSVITYTVLSMTTSTGHYQILTTAGNILYCTNYYDWYSQQTQDTYTATVTGTDGSAYLIANPILIAQHYNHIVYFPEEPRYYEYNGRYWQCDRTSCDPIQYKQVRGERVIHGQPPFPYLYWN